MRLLDMFCGAGGAAEGYRRAGFDEIVGVDNKPQPRYPFHFVRADALDFCRSFGAGFDAAHASPPCQRYSVANNIHADMTHPDLVGPTRSVLRSTGRPYVIENVPGAPLKASIVLCGSSFGIGVKRHRLFESNTFLWGKPCVAGHPGDWVCVFGHTVLERSPAIGRTAKNGPIYRRKHLGAQRGREAMGISWMTREELSEAIPPAYTEFIGRQLIAALSIDEGSEARKGHDSKPVVTSQPSTISKGVETPMTQAVSHKVEAPPATVVGELYKAVKHTLDQIQENPDVHYYCGYSTQIFYLLIRAEAAHLGLPLETVEAERRKDRQPSYRRREPEVCRLRDERDELRMQLDRGGR